MDMTQYDTESTRQVLSVFKVAWLSSIEDYENRKINSEHCLQASLYRHMVNSLPEIYTVYVEAVVGLSDAIKEETGKRVAKIDFLVCQGDEVVVAIEIKYIPRGIPKVVDIRKDLASLSCISNRLRLSDRCFIEIPRFRSEDVAILILQVLSQRKLIFASFCSDDAPSMLAGNFWSEHRPRVGYWDRVASFPLNLCVAMAYTSADGKARPAFFGPGFDRMRCSGEI